MSVAAHPEVRTTRRGTACAASWDDAWVAQIELREQTLDRRICGARTIGGTPCAMPSDHPSGRCRHHGGFPLTGAPADNRNAVVHGLYSRRLMICGSHCPAWQSCPLGAGSTFALETEVGGRASSRAGAQTDAAPSLSSPRKRGPLDSPQPNTETETAAPTATFIRHPDGSTERRFRGGRMITPAPGASETPDTSESSDPSISSTQRRTAPPSTPSTKRRTAPPSTPSTPVTTYAQSLLQLPLAERPQCPYEVAEYNAVVTDTMQRTCANADHAFGLHLAHQIALITVMVSRAARALAIQPFTETMEQSSEYYHMNLNRPSAALIAFEKLSRELRRWILQLDQHYTSRNIARPTAREHELRQRVDHTPDPDGLATLDLTQTLARKEHTQQTNTRNATLDQIDRQIVETLFARFKTKPSTVSPEKEKANPKEIYNGEKETPRNDDS